MHWSKVGDIRAPDEEIMAWARDHGYIVFTHDLDFGAMLFATNAESPSVVQLRAAHILPEVLGEAVLEAFAATKEGLEAGALVTIYPSRQRLRMLPLRGEK